MTDTPAEDGLTLLIAGDLERGIASYGYPVGMGLAPSPADCERAARNIVGRIKDRALELLAERQAEHAPTRDGGPREGVYPKSPFKIRSRGFARRKTIA